MVPSSSSPEAATWVSSGVGAWGLLGSCGLVQARHWLLLSKSGGWVNRGVRAVCPYQRLGQDRGSSHLGGGAWSCGSCSL